MRKIFLASLVILSSFLFAGCNLLEWKQQAGLQVITQEVPSSLFLDDQYLDKAPFINKKIKPGNYTLRIQPDDTAFVPYDIPITLHKGTITVVTWEPGPSLETSGGVMYEMSSLKDSQKVELEFQTIPNNAILTLDGGTKQFSPLTITDLTEGTHGFSASLPSYKTQEHSVTLLKGYKVVVTVILGKTQESIALATPPPASQEDTLETPPAALPSPEAPDSGSPLSATIQVQILSTQFFVEGKEVLRVRDAPSAAGREIGFAPVGNFYPYKEEQNGWLAIDFENTMGWVSAQFSQKVPATSSAQPR